MKLLRNFRLPYALWLLVAVVVVGLTGCDSSNFPVEGRVVFSDQQAAAELRGGVVECQAIDIKPSVSPRGLIGPEGKFVLGTNSENDGAPAGRYRVLVMPPVRVDESKKSTSPVMDRKYQRFDTSGIEITVEPKPNQVTITVGRAKG